MATADAHHDLERSARLAAERDALIDELARATGLGWTAGIGRIGAICGPLLGGVLLTAGIVYPWGFYAFAVVAALAAVGVAALNAASRLPDPAASRTGTNAETSHQP